MKFKNKNVLVYGLSASGEWAAKLLVKLKANVFLYDDNYELLRFKVIKHCYLLEKLNKSIISQFDCMVVSPSIEKDNKYLVMAEKLGIKIYSELEFASTQCKKLVAITGTNGKTTTTQLITNILNSKFNAVACGNIGYTLSQAVLKNKRAIKVCEVSSFMLEHCQTFAPHVATVLNISQDHLIRHKTMEEYANLKLSIYKNLTIKDFAVVNLDENLTQPTWCKCITYSQKRIADVYLKNGYIYLHNNKIVATSELKLKGKHNISNVMCAICFGFIYKVPLEKIKQSLLSFKPEDFRLQTIANIGGVKFVNDSKSTNIASTLSAVNSINRPIILMLGGSNKDLDYTSLFKKLPKRVKLCVVYGKIKEDLIKANAGKYKLMEGEHLADAFKLATESAIANDVVLLSPATASYDEFKSYIERGNSFNSLVSAYETSKESK